MAVPYFVRKHLLQTMVYWANPVSNGEGGFTFDDPIEIQARCEFRNELVRTETNEEAVSRARIYLSQVVQNGEYLYLGTLEDSGIDDDIHPEDVYGSMRVLSLDIMPRLRGNGYMYKAFVNSNKYGNN